MNNRNWENKIEKKVDDYTEEYGRDLSYLKLLITILSVFLVLLSLFGLGRYFYIDYKNKKTDENRRSQLSNELIIIFNNMASLFIDFNFKGISEDRRKKVHYYFNALFSTISDNMRVVRGGLQHLISLKNAIPFNLEYQLDLLIAIKNYWNIPGNLASRKKYNKRIKLLEEIDDAISLFETESKSKKK